MISLLKTVQGFYSVSGSTDIDSVDTERSIDTAQMMAKNNIDHSWTKSYSIIAQH
jgi:hypothetical protein